MLIKTAEFIAHYGTLSGRAVAEAVTITNDGRDRLVVLSGSDRQAVSA
jgi:hypothetical protein